jgi:KUP system potassium uptake protein
MTDRRRERRSRRYLLVTSFAALGVVYGDIGTSPLYAVRESFAAAGPSLAVTRDHILGILSLIFWALIVIVTIKYLSFVMRADNGGEGGVLALTALIFGPGKTRTRLILIAIGLFGSALLFGDGMITPAISVLSAVEGIEVAVPGLEPWVVFIAAVILVLLFSNQHRGTATLGSWFGPVMLVWFSTLAILGLIHIVQGPGVLVAVNPLLAVEFIVANPKLGFLALGGVFLVVTGSEALYADMGHFGKRPIRLGWAFVVFPALVLNYFGQGALLISDPAAIENPFYQMAPSWSVLPLVVLATLATVIASQALISGVYSLSAQAIQLGYLPRMRVDHTSEREFGQIYVPAVNWTLMAAAVGLVFAFGSSSALAGAYGVGVASTMVITTVLLAVVMRERWHWGIPAIVGVAGAFMGVDLLFFASNITKVPSGGWFPLVIGLAFFAVMTTWHRGRELLADRLKRRELPVERFIASIVANPQQRVSGTAVYLFPQPGDVPPALLTNLQHNEVLHETVVLVAVMTSDGPRVPQALRATVHNLGEGFYQVVLVYGFSEEPDVPTALHNIVSHEFGFDPVDATYFLGRETVLATEIPGMSPWREHLFAFMHRNAASAARFFGLPPNQVVEMGVQVAI